MFLRDWSVGFVYIFNRARQYFIEPLLSPYLFMLLFIYSYNFNCFFFLILIIFLVFTEGGTVYLSYLILFVVDYAF